MSSFSQKNTKTYSLPSTILTVILFIAIFLFLNLVPDIMFHKLPSMLDYLDSKFLVNPTKWNIARYCLFWINFGISTPLMLLLIWIGVRSIFVLIFDKRDYLGYSSKAAQIINSCDSSKFNDKVALLVAVCNDFEPNSLIQTANQTYKNIDVWICDDSSKPELISKIDQFAQLHKFNVFRRPTEHKKLHKSKVGNIKAWCDQYSKKYDYIFENDSSNIATSTFVENALSYFHSPLLKEQKIGAICCNGSAYPTKNFISWIRMYEWSILANEFGNQGLVNRTIGSMWITDGWCNFVKASVLDSIPLEKVECSVDDCTRGLLLMKNGYTNYFDPFDFAGKMGIQTIEAFKNQRMKWKGGDYFIKSTKLSEGEIKNTLTSFFTKLMCFQNTTLLTLSFSLSILNVVISLMLNIFYWNWSILILGLCAGAILLFVLFFYFRHINLDIFVILWWLLWIGALEYSVTYKLLYQYFIKGLILKTTSVSTNVTQKSLYKSTTKEKIKMSKFDFIISLISLGICLTLTFTIGSATQHLSNTNSIFESIGYINNWVVWFSLFPFLCGPSLVYVIMVWVGEKQVKKGWEPSMKYFPIEKYDFRYNYVMNSEIWIKQHGVGEKAQISEPHTHTHTAAKTKS